MHVWINEEIELGIRHLQASLKRKIGSRVEMGRVETVILRADGSKVLEHIYVEIFKVA